MKLVIQIPCYNEEEQIAGALSSIPKELVGIDRIGILVINDGSTDRTIEEVKKFPEVSIYDLEEHMGLAQVFFRGIKKSLDMGADIIVNFDADLQYSASDIPALIAPILEGRTDVVIGERPYLTLDHFSIVKKVLLIIGSKIISLITGYKIRDAASGFRAFHRRAVEGLYIYSNFTYTLETILFFSRHRVDIETVSLGGNNPTRPSRLFKTNLHYIILSAATVINTILRYKLFDLRNKR